GQILEEVLPILVGGGGSDDGFSTGLPDAIPVDITDEGDGHTGDAIFRWVSGTSVVTLRDRSTAIDWWQARAIAIGIDVQPDGVTDAAQLDRCSRDWLVTKVDVQEDITWTEYHWDGAVVVIGGARHGR